MIPFDRYDKDTLKTMFDGQEVSPLLPYYSFDSDREVANKVLEGNGRISLSGVQPKYAMVVDNGKLRLTEREERGTYILKPAPTESFILDRDECPVNEYLTMHIAEQVFGIPTAKNCLCFLRNGKPAYLTKRFDITRDGEKIQQEDFASIAGISKDTHGKNYKYDVLSYEECANLISEHVKAAKVEVLKFFRLVVFNYLFCNDDAHAKNFSLIAYKNNDYVLTPAYDLLNTMLHLAQPQIFALTKGLFREGMLIDDTHSVTRSSFEEFGKRIGLPPRLVDYELGVFAEENSDVRSWVEKSDLSDSSKSLYYTTYDYQRKTLGR